MLNFVECLSKGYRRAKKFQKIVTKKAFKSGLHCAKSKQKDNSLSLSEWVYFVWNERKNLVQDKFPSHHSLQLGSGLWLGTLLPGTSFDDRILKSSHHFKYTSEDNHFPSLSLDRGNSAVLCSHHKPQNTLSYNHGDQLEQRYFALKSCQEVVQSLSILFC